jgi:hypothetical protein
MGFVEISTSLHEWLPVETHLADGDLQHVAVHRHDHDVDG